MEIKKSPKADLEGKKTTWLLAGYVMVMAVLFLGFEWTQRDVKIDTSNQVVETVFEEEIEIPITEQPEQVQAPPPEAPSIAETLTIVDDDSDIQESAIQSSEETGQAVEIKYTATVAVQEEEEEEPRDLETILTGDDPFNESDLPLLQLAEEKPGEEAPPEAAGEPEGDNPPEA